MAQTVTIVRNVLKGVAIAALVFGCLVCGSRANHATAQSWTSGQTLWTSSGLGSR